MSLLLVRHPAPEIAPGICYGRLDVPARAEGVAKLAAEVRAHGVARVWTSPALRCRAVAERTGLPSRAEPRLWELDFGDWEGRAWDDVPRAALDAWAADPENFAPPGGESGAALLARVREVFFDLLAAGDDVAVVSHGGPLKLLAALLRGEAPDLLAPAPPFGSVQVFG
jgi:alpha-ribazole phosphatase